MNHLKRENTEGKSRILVAPLDWGLGHTTRCIPIIRELLHQGAQVSLAGNGLQANLLLAEFPELTCFPLPGYNIRYARTRAGLLLSMVFQASKIVKSINHEKKWMNGLLDKHPFDAIISDNRYGLYHEKIPSIFITHQLRIKSPLGKWSENILQRRNYRYIQRFTECWIPDHEGTDNLAGELSHPKALPPIPVKYTGPLTRFIPGHTSENKGHLLFILSGPEPQRTILENKIVDEIAHYKGSATIVRGLPGASSLIPSTNMVKFYNHLPAAQLNDEILKAEYIISRSGYTTVMDMAALQKKSILIPTPGQTEQEYLATYLERKKFACCLQQKDFSIAGALEKAKQFSYSLSPASSNEKLAHTIAAFLSSVTRRDRKVMQ